MYFGDMFGDRYLSKYSSETHYHTMQEQRQRIFHAMRRNVSETEIHATVQAFIGAIVHTTEISDIFVLVFYGRWCRGGKGERRAALQFICALHDVFPEGVVAALPLLPQYGSWKDLLELGSMLPILQDDICRVYAEQLLRDKRHVKLSENTSFIRNIFDFICSLFKAWNVTKKREAIENVEQKCSLAGKYAPSHGSHYDKQWGAARGIRIYLEKNSGQSWTWKRYRELKSALGNFLDVVEVKMCARERSKIDFATVPAVAMLRNSRTFLNLNQKSIQDHIECAKRFKDFLSSPDCRLKGGQLQAHDLVKSALDIIHQKTKKSNKEVLNAQWNGLVQETRKHIVLWKQSQVSDDTKNKISAVTAINNVAMEDIDDKDVFKVLSITKDVINDMYGDSFSSESIPNVVCMADVSGSMTGRPMEVSIAMALLTATFSKNKQNIGKFMTFETEPQWHYVDTTLPFFDQVKIVSESPWGGSTNFTRAMNLLLQDVQSGVPAPDSILIVSDMCWTEAMSSESSWNSERSDSDWKILMDDIHESFSKLGCATPTIFFWNVHSIQNESVDTVHIPGVVMLQGFSQQMLNIVFTSKQEIKKDTDQVSNVLNNTDDVIEDILQNQAFLPVREMIKSTLEYRGI